MNGCGLQAVLFIANSFMAGGCGLPQLMVNCISACLIITYLHDTVVPLNERVVGLENILPYKGNAFTSIHQEVTRKSPDVSE